MPVKDELDNDNSGLLSEATLLALNLRHQPFTSELRDAAAMQDDTASPAAPFSDAVTEEQLADVKQALITGDDLLLILGEDGAGKTTLLQQLNDNSGLRIECFPVKGSERFSTTNLFAGMLAAFKRQPPDPLKDILDELIPCLQSMSGKNTLCTIVLDDAHLAGETELTQLLSAMLYLNSQDETLLRIAMSASPEFENSIPELLPEGADLPYSSLTIEGMIPVRAAAYLDYRLQLAGFDQEFPFTERDMASLVDHSAGKPRELHALTADVLNEKYGRLEYSAPREIAASGEGSGFFQSRSGKLALGALATALIVGGLLFFLPASERSPDADTSNNSSTLVEEDDAQQPAVADTSENESDNSAGENENQDDTQTAQNSAGTGDQTEASTALTDGDASQSAELSEESIAETAAALQSEASQESLAQSSEESPPEVLDLSELSNDSATQSQDVTSITEEQTGDPQSDSEESDSPSSGNQSSELQVSEPDEDSNEEPAASVTEELPISQEPEVQLPEPADNLPIVESQPLEEDTAPESGTPTDEPGVQDSSVASNIDPQLAGILESPNWILVQDESLFTIQMTASRDLNSVQNFLRRNPLPSPNSIFSFERDGEVWYALVHGTFSGLGDARLAVERMPDAARRDQPWIRSIARVKEILRQP